MHAVRTAALPAVTPRDPGWWRALAAVAVALLAAPVGALMPRDGHPVAVVFAPGTPPSEALARHVAAGAPLLGSGAAGWITLAPPIDAATRARLGAAGAILLDLAVLDALCGRN